MKTLAQLAKEAIDVQDAVNGFAIATSYGRMMCDLRAALVELDQATDTDALRAHPINRMWASKIHDLAGMGLSDDERYAAAYAWCRAQLDE